MIDQCFFNEIVHFVPFEDRENISSICKNNDEIQKIRKDYLNRKSAKLLKSCLITYAEHIDFLRTSILSGEDLAEIFIDIYEECCGEDFSLGRAHIKGRMKGGYIIHKTSCFSSLVECMNYIPLYKLRKYNGNVHKNIPLCSVYRLPRFQKSLLTKYFPYAKALIY